jgi:L-iditol 2-dehydrogenase
VVHGAKAIFRLPDTVSYEQGAVVDPASIALHCANRGGISPGDSVAIVGAGAIGLLGGDAASIRGAGRVIVVGRGSRLEKARSMGFDVVDVTLTDPIEAVRMLTGGLGADVVLEAAGSPQTLEWALLMLRRGGRCASVGIPNDDASVDLRRLVLDELELVGSRASAGEMRRVMPHVESGRMRVSNMITHEFPLERYLDALATFRDRTSGAIKIIVKP